jgi:hypothetical protein
MLLDRDVFSGDKAMIPKTVPRLIVVGIAKEVIMKGPRPAWLSNEMPNLIRLSIPKTTHSAAIADGLPLAFVDATILIKRRRELVAPFTASIREIVIACKLKTDLI